MSLQGNSTPDRSCSGSGVEDVAGQLPQSAESENPVFEDGVDESSGPAVEGDGKVPDNPVVDDDESDTLEVDCAEPDNPVFEDGSSSSTSARIACLPVQSYPSVSQGMDAINIVDQLARSGVAERLLSATC
ncbi:hypothetical protein V6N13_015430 [Hibiscus sabdariffa]